VLVPGVDTTFADFDRGLGGVARRAPAVQARNLYAVLASSSSRVAVVAWLGYHPPQGLGLDAAREDVARDGAAALTSFVRGIAAPGRRITLIGHSYGAIVVGLAAARLPFVRDLVTLGAPGMGVDRASQLGGARVWSALAEADWIRRVPEVRVLDLGHGRRPSSPGFGSVLLPSGGVAGHDYYLTPGSVTLAAVANVVLYSSATAPSSSSTVDSRDSRATSSSFATLASYRASSPARSSGAVSWRITPAAHISSATSVARTASAHSAPRVTSVSSAPRAQAASSAGTFAGASGGAR
jgi:pimeloyl-ACP methyl ester carboxylesterase